MHQDAATDIHRDIGTEQMRLLREVTVASIGLPKYFAMAVVERLRDVVRSASPTSMFLPLTVRFMFFVQQTGVMPHSCPVGHSA